VYVNWYFRTTASKGNKNTIIFEIWTDININLLFWIWRQYVPPKKLTSTRKRITAITQKTIIRQSSRKVHEPQLRLKTVFVFRLYLLNTPTAWQSWCASGQMLVWQWRQKFRRFVWEPDTALTVLRVAEFQFCCCSGYVFLLSMVYFATISVSYTVSEEWYDGRWTGNNLEENGRDLREAAY
jgi:hypothetical protein